MPKLLAVVRAMAKALLRPFRGITMPKLSACVLEMAKTVRREPDATPSTEAAHAALLFTHVAWNKALGDTDALGAYRALLAELEKSNPALWNEFAHTDHECIIDALVVYKKQRRAVDTRVIRSCGMRRGDVHVEWSDGPTPPGQVREHG